MRNSFKQPSFDQHALKRFWLDITAAGIPATLVWKKGTNQISEQETGASVCIMELDGKWFFRQTRNNGAVMLDTLSGEQKDKLLQRMRQYGLYSKPQWALSIGLLILYIVIECIVIVSREEAFLQILLSAGCLFVVQFMLTSWFHSNAKAGDSFYKVSMVFGIIGYFLTAPASMMALPLFIAFSHHNLYKQIFPFGREAV